MKGWRTVILNGLVILAALAAGLDTPVIHEMIPAEVAWVSGLLATVNIVLRAITTSPIGRKR